MRLGFVSLPAFIAFVFATIFLTAERSYAAGKGSVARSAYNFPVQPLSQALRELAEKTGLQLFFDAKVVEGKTAPSLQGDFSALEAADRLLYGSGLTYQFIDDSVLVITIVPDASIGPVSQQDGPKFQEDRVSEIVVTGRKQPELVQDVPLSIDVLTGAVIEDRLLVDIRDATNAVPGLEFQQTATRQFERPVIRGQATILSATESGVETFVDGLSFHSAISTISLADIDIIEVIKGPQSALYGRNTYSGAISITTQKPTDEMRLRSSFRAGQYDEYDAAVGASGPFFGSDQLRAGLYLRHYEYGGEYRNLYDGQRIGNEKSDSVSAVFDYEPVSEFSLLARFNYGKDNDGPPAMYLTPDSLKNVGLELNGDTVAEFYKGRVPTFPVNYDSEFVSDPGFEQERYWASVRADWAISERLTATSITGFEDSEQSVVQDFDLLPTSIFLPLRLVLPSTSTGELVAQATFGGTENRQDQSTWQQEVRLAYDPGGRYRSLLGFYYYDDAFVSSRLADPEDELASDMFADALADLEAAVFPEVIGSVRSPADRRRIISRDTRNWAVFGRLDIDLTDVYNLTLEARYQQERLHYSVFEFEQSGDIVSGSDTFRSFVPRLTLQYAPDDNHQVYILAANGTKPGGVNDDGGFDPLVNRPTFNEEDIWSFEAGSKNTFMEGRLVFNSAIYFNHISDLQITESVVQSDSTADTVIVNRGTADIWGLEFQANHMSDRIKGLGVYMSYAYNDSNLSAEVTQSDQGILDDIQDDGVQNCSMGDADPRETRCKSIATSVGGNRLPRSSRHQVSAGISYQRRLSASYDWFVRADYSYNSPQFVSAVNIAEYGEASIVNMSTGIENDQFRVSLWAKNLTAENSPLSVINFINLSSFENTLYGTLRRGRQFGVSVAFDF